MTNEEWAEYLAGHPEVDSVRNATAWRPRADQHRGEPRTRDTRPDHPASQGTVGAPSGAAASGVQAFVCRLPLGGTIVGAPHGDGFRVRFELSRQDAERFVEAFDHFLDPTHPPTPCPVHDLLGEQWGRLLLVLDRLLRQAGGGGSQTVGGQ